jgi:nucleotide-binding universal stress UspA family protein
VTDPEGARAIRRILVALDASPDSLAAMEAAAELASRLDAELAGLFVEDVRLVQAAALSLARAVNVSSATERVFDLDAIERELRAQAARIRLALAAVGDRLRVRWTLRVARGQVAAEVLGAARGADLLLIGRGGRLRSREAGLGSVARAAATEAAAPVLLLRAGTRITAPVLVGYDGSPASGRALAFAVALARAGGGGLLVMVESADEDTARRLEEDAAARIGDSGLPVRFRHVPPGDGRRLREAVIREGAGMLVLDGRRDDPALRDLARWLPELDRPVLILR